MIKPKVIVLAGYGLNCEEETAAAFTLAGAEADIVHVNDLVVSPKKLLNYQILAIPGGFSYGDDLGGGKAYANKLKNHLEKNLHDFIAKDKLVIGICNGFQILTQAGLLPGALAFNDNNRYTDRWVDVLLERVTLSKRGSPSSPWLVGIDHISLPIAHGEGKYMADTHTLSTIKKRGLIAGVYYKGEICEYQNLEANPNGASADLAMLTSKDGKILGTMPHPERAMFFVQHPMWPLWKEKLLREGNSLPKFGDGLKVFKNAVNYFK